MIAVDDVVIVEIADVLFKNSRAFCSVVIAVVIVLMISGANNTLSFLTEIFRAGFDKGFVLLRFSPVGKIADNGKGIKTLVAVVIIGISVSTVDCGSKPLRRNDNLFEVIFIFLLSSIYSLNR